MTNLDTYILSRFVTPQNHEFYRDFSSLHVTYTDIPLIRPPWKSEIIHNNQKLPYIGMFLANGAIAYIGTPPSKKIQNWKTVNPEITQKWDEKESYTYMSESRTAHSSIENTYRCVEIFLKETMFIVESKNDNTSNIIMWSPPLHTLSNHDKIKVQQDIKQFHG